MAEEIGQSVLVINLQAVPLTALSLTVVSNARLGVCGIACSSTEICEGAETASGMIGSCL